MASEKTKPLETDALAGDVSKGFDEIQNLPARIERYSKARARSEQTISYLRDIYQGRIEYTGYLLDEVGPLIQKLDNCGQWLRFRQYYTVGKVRLSEIKTCQKHLLCPLCAIRRGAKQVKAYLDRFEVIRAENPVLVPYLVTLTVANGPDLQERMDHLQKSFRTYLNRRRAFFKNGRGFNELCKVEGGAFSYEVTMGKKWNKERTAYRETGWHPHLHMVALVDPNNPIDFDSRNPKSSALSQEWHDITGDSFVVDARPIQGDPAQGFVEVFKYALKFSELEHFDQLTAYSILKGRRLTGSFGCFWGVKVPDTDSDELLEDLPYIELFYRYTKAGYTLHHSASEISN